MKHLLISIAAILLFSCTVGEKTQSNSMENETNSSLKSAKGKVFGFYNVENLFDTIDSKYTIDEAFLPEAEKEWNSKKYNEKLTFTPLFIEAVAKAIVDFPMIKWSCSVNPSASHAIRIWLVMSMSDVEGVGSPDG